MRKYIAKAVVSLMAGFLLLPSCGKDADAPILKTRENTWHWGYFDGYVNNQKISFENDFFEPKIKSFRQGIYHTEDENISRDSINLLNTCIRYGENATIDIHLYVLKPGVQYLILEPQTASVESGIQVVIEDVCYIPKQEIPFSIDILNITWLSPWEPILEAKLSGILYKEDNPQDSIIVNAVYGTR